MATNHYVHIFRRRREGKTDYRKRRGMIFGRTPFLAVRVSGRYIYAQILKPAPQGDLTLCSASSRNLAKFGWKGSAKNLPSAFLTGYHLGKLAKEKKVNDVILYSGVGRFVHGSRIASVVKGAKEAGLDISVGEDILPADERVKGTHVEEYAKKLETESKEKFGQLFSRILANGSSPANYSSDFDKVKVAIDKGAKN